MKSLTKNIYTLTGLAAMLLLSCSKEDRYLCSDNDPTPLTTRSVVSLDSLNSGELVLLEETEELLKLKNLMARKRSSNVGAMAVGVSDVDEFFASNMNAISGLSVNISVRSTSSGSSTSKKYLKCSGNGKEVTLDELSESDETIDEDWILDDYGIRDWVESLPTKSISLATIANSYKIIGL